MSAQFQLEAQLRTDLGKSASRRTRRLENQIPAIVYGAGKDVQPIVLDHNKVVQALQNEAMYTRILTLQLGKTKEQVILKALQRHPAKPRIMHMDFFRIDATHKLTMRLPLRIVGETTSPGVKKGGHISRHMTDLEIRCLPSDLPEFIEVNIANLDLGHVLHLADLKLPAGVEMTTSVADEEHNRPVVGVHILKEMAEEPLRAAEGEASAAEAGAEKEKESKEKESKDKK